MLIVSNDKRQEYQRDVETDAVTDLLIATSSLRRPAALYGTISHSLLVSSG